MYSDEQDWPTVYHLLGKCSELPDEYVISEEDLLEFVCALHSAQGDRQPKKLFDALRNSYLLILGGNFPDWLARFFLRLARPDRLSRENRALEILADSRSSEDQGLVLFLKCFSTCTRLVSRQGGIFEFVDELWQRCRQRNLQPPHREWAPPPDRTAPEGAVFISYAKEDRPAVQNLKDGLVSEGITVWFDKQQLQMGDNWREKISKNIDHCSCFLAVLSQSAKNPGQRYFLGEWSCALVRQPFEPGKFIIPVVIDATTDFSEFQPSQLEQLLKYQSESLPGGVVTPAFVQIIRNIVRDYRSHKQQRRL